MRPSLVASLLAFLMLAGCAAPGAIPDGTTAPEDAEASLGGPPSDAEVALADAARPPAPESPACATDAPRAGGSGFEGIRWNVSSRTPETSIEDARVGIEGAQSFLAACLGGDVDAAMRTPLWLDLRSSAAGDERHPVPWEAAWGKDVPGEGRIRADVNGSDGFPDRAGWSFRADQQKTFAHEYTHIWHQLVGCGGTNPPSPAWFTEGLADYVGYGQGVAAGNISRDDARAFLWRVAWFDGQLDEPFSELEQWPGHVGYFAIETLVGMADEGPAVLRSLCERTAGAGGPDGFQRAFVETFGVTLEAFERSFHEQHRRS